MRVRKLEVEPHARAHRRRLPQRAPVEIAHERKAAREHAAMRERIEQLSAALDRGEALTQQQPRRAFAALGERGHAFMLPRDAAAVGIGVGPQARGEARACRGQPFAPAVPCDVLGAPGALGQRGHQLAAAHDARAQELRAEPADDARELRVVDLRVGDQRARQPRARLVEPLARQREQRLRRRERARGRAQLAAPRLLATPPAGERAPRQAVEPPDEIDPHRDRQLGGGGRRRRAHVGGEVDERHVGLVPDRRDQRDRARRHRSHHDLLVERPQVLERAAAARDDEKVGPADRPVERKRVEAADGGGDLLGRAVALHAHRPHDHVAREAVGEPVQDVADDGARGRCDDADQLWQERQELLARRVEQAFGRELALALLNERHERAESSRLERLDHDLVFRLAGIGGQPPGDEDLEPLLGLEPPAGERSPPDHRLDFGILVLEREIAVAGGGVRPLVAGDFSAHTHVAEGILDGLAQRRRELGDGPFPDIVDARRLVHGCDCGSPNSCAVNRRFVPPGQARKRLPWSRTTQCSGGTRNGGRGRPDRCHRLALWFAAESSASMSVSQQGSENTVAELQARLARDPDDLETLVALAGALRRLGRTADAIAYFRRALTAHPNVAEIWFNLGNAQSATGDAAAAAESYARALALKPDMGPAHFNLGNVLRDRGALDAAEAAYRRALALMPEHAVLHMNLGNLLRRLDRSDEAIACHRRALALEPQRHEARFNLANALVALGERDEAARCYREVLAARPDFADATVNLAALLLSDRASAEADEVIAGLLARDPQSRAALMLLGRRRIVEERWAEAEAALRHALEAGAAEDADAQALRGLCLFRLGDAAGRSLSALARHRPRPGRGGQRPRRGATGVGRSRRGKRGFARSRAPAARGQRYPDQSRQRPRRAGRGR